MMQHALISVLSVMFILPETLSAGDGIRWICFPDSSFEVNGLAWFDENNPDLLRLPKRLKEVVREPVWNLAQSTSGASIRFKSDCSTLAIRYENLRMSGMKNMHVFGQSGVDLYLHHVNLGFSGNGKGEKEVADAVAEIDASCFVLDFMANNKNWETLEKVYEPFVRTIREKHPTIPIILLTRIYAARESSILGGHELIEAKRGVVRKAYKKLIAEGDRNLSLIEGHSLLGLNEVDGLVDGSHPNDLGFQLMADRLAPVIARTLRLSER